MTSSQSQKPPLAKRTGGIPIASSPKSGNNVMTTPSFGRSCHYVDVFHSHKLIVVYDVSNKQDSGSSKSKQQWLQLIVPKLLKVGNLGYQVRLVHADIGKCKAMAKEERRHLFWQHPKTSNCSLKLFVRRVSASKISFLPNLPPKQNSQSSSKVSGLSSNHVEVIDLDSDTETSNENKTEKCASHQNQRNSDEKNENTISLPTKEKTDSSCTEKVLEKEESPETSETSAKPTETITFTAKGHPNLWGLKLSLNKEKLPLKTIVSAAKTISTLYRVNSVPSTALDLTEHPFVPNTKIMNLSATRNVRQRPLGLRRRKAVFFSKVQSKDELEDLFDKIVPKKRTRQQRVSSSDARSQSGRTQETVKAKDCALSEKAVQLPISTRSNRLVQKSNSRLTRSQIQSQNECTKSDRETESHSESGSSSSSGSSSDSDDDSSSISGSDNSSNYQECSERITRAQKAAGKSAKSNSTNSYKHSASPVSNKTICSSKSSKQRETKERVYRYKPPPKYFCDASPCCPIRQNSDGKILFSLRAKVASSEYHKNADLLENWEKFVRNESEVAGYFKTSFTRGYVTSLLIYRIEKHQKKLIVDRSVELNSDGTIAIMLENEDITSELMKYINVETNTHLNSLLINLANTSLCKGCGGETMVTFYPAADLKEDRWFSKSCRKLMFSPVEEFISSPSTTFPPGSIEQQCEACRELKSKLEAENNAIVASRKQNSWSKAPNLSETNSGKRPAASRRRGGKTNNSSNQLVFGKYHPPTSQDQMPFRAALNDLFLDFWKELGLPKEKFPSAESSSQVPSVAVISEEDLKKALNESDLSNNEGEKIPLDNSDTNEIIASSREAEMMLGLQLPTGPIPIVENIDVDEVTGQAYLTFSDVPLHINPEELELTSGQLFGAPQGSDLSCDSDLIKTLMSSSEIDTQQLLQCFSKEIEGSGNLEMDQVSAQNFQAEVDRREDVVSYHTLQTVSFASEQPHECNISTAIDFPSIIDSDGTDDFGFFALHPVQEAHDPTTEFL